MWFSTQNAYHYTAFNGGYVSNWMKVINVWLAVTLDKIWILNFGSKTHHNDYQQVAALLLTCSMGLIQSTSDTPI